MWCAPDVEESSEVTLDAADVADADAFQELQDFANEQRSATIPDQGRVDGFNIATIPDEEGVEEPELPRTDENDLGDPDTMATVVIDRFPFGSPGIPVPPPHGTSAHNSSRDSSGESMPVWAPFQSRKDWEFALWVKTRGSTSNAVDELLAVPGVCRFSYPFIVSNR
jgi:hypothetical protein